MPTTVICPECGRDATVIGQLLSPAGSPEYLRVRCEGLLSLLVAVSETRPSRHPACA